MDTAQKIEAMEKKILGQFDSTFQAYDFEEVLSLYTTPEDRMLCWNAGMNLVEQGRVHVIQVREKFNEEHVRWILVGFDYEVLSNQKFVPPGPVFNADSVKATDAVKFKKAWKKSSSVEEVANELAETIDTIKRWVSQFRKLGFNFAELPDYAVVAQPCEVMSATVEEVCVTPECVTETTMTLPNSQVVEAPLG